MKRSRKRAAGATRPPCIRLLIIAVAWGAAVQSPADALGPRDRRLTSSRSGISVEAPSGWTLSQHTGYAETVVLLIYPDGSRISVTAAPTESESGEALYRQNRPGLIAQGLLPTPAGIGARASFAVDLTAIGKPDKMRQLYLVRDTPLGRQAIILTLAAPLNAFPARIGALDSVANRLTFDEPAAPSGSKRVPGRSPGTGGATRESEGRL